MSRGSSDSAFVVASQQNTYPTLLSVRAKNRESHSVVTKAAATSSESSSGWGLLYSFGTSVSDADCPHAVLLEEPLAAARCAAARDVSRAEAVEQPDAPVVAQGVLQAEVVEPDAPVVERGELRDEVVEPGAPAAGRGELRDEVVEQPGAPVVARGERRASVRARDVPAAEPGASRAVLSALDVLVAAWAGSRVLLRAWASCAWAAGVPPVFPEEPEDGLQAAQVRGGRAQPVHSDAPAVPVADGPAARLALRVHWALPRVYLAAHRVPRPVCWGVPAHSVSRLVAPAWLVGRRAAPVACLAADVPRRGPDA